MRVLNGSTEIYGKCSVCNAEFGYTVGDVQQEVFDPVHDNGCSADSVENILKEIESDPVFGSQFTKRQLALMKRHKDWCCEMTSMRRKVTCPCCGRIIEVSPVLHWMALHPEGSFEHPEADEFLKFNPIATLAEYNPMEGKPKKKSKR